MPRCALAALETLGDLGDASIVALLVERASQKTPEQDAARQSLARLHRGDVRRALVDLGQKAVPALKVEAVRALAARRDPQAIPFLLQQVESTDEQMQISALQGLANLANEAVVDRLVGLLQATPSAPLRTSLEGSLVSIADRLQQSDQIVARLLAAMPQAKPENRAALLHAAGHLGGARALTALRTSVKEADPQVRDAALRALADFAGLEAAPDLLQLAHEAPTDTGKIYALRGYWHVVALANKTPVERQFQLCQDGLAAACRPEEKRMGLSQLAKLSTPEALALANRLRSEEALRAEADLARFQIAGRLVLSHRTEALATLRALMSGAVSESLRAEAASLVKSLDERADYLVAWLVSGPYRQEGKQAQQLFDIAFPPEKPKADKVEWKAAPPPASPTLFWQVDLSSRTGGDQCVLYLKTRVFVPKDMEAALAIGSDDGIKLWVNGKQVHANNAVRGLGPDQDKARAQLKCGWNDFLAKITQSTAGCGVCIRVRTADGKAIQGLCCEAK